MNWMSKLERKFGKYAVPNLMNYIIILYGFGFVLELVKPGFYSAYLSLNMAAILRGQVWRLFTFLVEAPTTSILFAVFTLLLYYMIGRELEYVWGAFRFNLYFFVGVIFHVIAALLMYVLLHVSLPLGTYYLNMSLFFAYAAMFPNQQFLMFGVLPLKVKYIAWIDAAMFAYTILQAFLPSYGGSEFGWYYKANALAAFVSILNFLIFFFASRNMVRYSPKEMKRKHAYHKAVREGRKEQTGPDGARHRCAVCGRTELDDDTLEFRYCSKCNGNYEYCQDHLFTHEHVK